MALVGQFYSVEDASANPSHAPSAMIGGVTPVPLPPWRIVFIAQILPAVQGFHAYATAAGHRPVAVLTTPSAQGRHLSPRNLDFFRQLVEGAPPELDVIVVSEKARLEPLILALDPDLLMVAGFFWRLPPEVLAIPRVGAVNSHPSLLPRHRGPVPFAWAVREGDTELGLTFHRMDEHFDTGAILAQGTVPLGEDDGFPDLAPRLGELSQRLLPVVFERLAAGDPGDPQSEQAATYAGHFGEDYRHVDWGEPAPALHRQVRAWQFAFAEDAGPLATVEGRTLRLIRSHVEPDASGAPGTVLRRKGDELLVACGEGALWLLETEQVEHTEGSIRA
ncbi:MAG: methionyl-tRNA formyltransferase [Gaiellaceae bacterium]